MRWKNRGKGGDSGSKMKEWRQRCGGGEMSCLPTFFPASLCSGLCRSQHYDQGLTLLWLQLLAGLEKIDQFPPPPPTKPCHSAHDSAKHSAAWQYRKGSGEHRKERIVAFQNENCSPLNELIFCPLAPTHLRWHKSGTEMHSAHTQQNNHQCVHGIHKVIERRQ